MPGMGLAPQLTVAQSQAQPVSVSTPDCARPAQDEWGFYDPEVAGFEAVMRRLTDRSAQDEAGEPDSSATVGDK